MKFKKKPVVAEARCYAKCSTNEEMIELMHWCNGSVKTMNDGSFGIAIDTRDGTMIASVGDWIIKEPFPTDDRKFYPCKPEQFEASWERTYED